MAYISDIPMSTDFINVSQGQIQANFQGIDALINVNHVDFDLGDQGKHKWVTFPVQSNIPTPPFLTSEVALYNKVPVGSPPLPTLTTQELYVQGNKASGKLNTPFTASILSSSTPVNGGEGWTYLPSGLILKFGMATSVVINGSFTGTVTFPVNANIPAFSVCLFVIANNYSFSTSGNTGSVSTYLPTSTNFTITTGAQTSPATINYFAIGY